VAPENEQSVFADPRGIRRRALQAFAILGMFLFLGASGYFIWGLLIEPELRLPAEIRNSRFRYKALPPAPPPLRDVKADWQRVIHTPPGPHGQAKISVKAKNAGIVLGYVSPWDPSSLLSLEHHADELTHVASEWFSITDVWGNLREDPSSKARLLCVRKGLGFLPILRNIDGDKWQPEAIEELAHSPPGERGAFLDKLVGRMPPGSTGLLIEWCQLDPTYKDETG
jgi:hypothetical protein